MKHKIFTASLLAISLLATGCGGTAPNTGSIPDISAAEDSTAETTYTDTMTTRTTAAETTAGVTSVPETANTTETKATAAPTEVNTTQKNTEAHQDTQVQTGPTAQQQEQPGAEVTQPQTTDVSTVTTVTETSTTAMTATIAITAPPETTTSVCTNPQPRTVLDSMTLEQKVCQMFMVTPDAITGISPMTEVGDGTRKAIEEYPVGGIIYFAQNLTSKEQTKKMIANTQNYAKKACGIGLFTAVDEEGGVVARCAQKLGTVKFKSMAHYGKANDSKTAYDIGSSLGKDLKSLGFNVDFAPVADVNICSANELGDRIFSSDPNVVANMCSYVTKGLQDEGVFATLKHFPGLGAENGNTHTNSNVVIDRTLEQLRETEFIPFSEGIKADVGFIMVGHQSVTGFGDELPCDLSYKAVTETLRKELGFEGIAISDSQQMNTISKVYTSGEAAKLSIKAGIDIILMPVDYRAAIDEVCAAVRSGEIPEKRIDESVMRILRKKRTLGLLKK